MARLLTRPGFAVTTDQGLPARDLTTSNTRSLAHGRGVVAEQP
jgi:hypothetical protein